MFYNPFFISSIFCFGVSLFFFIKEKESLAVGMLLIAGLLLRLFMAQLDPFLHNWDEKFHALVAKNMLQHPFSPTLMEHPLLEYDYKIWVKNHIWLHKQPFFLWQICLSFKLFGVHIFALRLPTVLLSSLLIGIIYGIGKLVFNKNTAFLAAVIICFYEPFLSMCTGFAHMEHNTLSFIFYVNLSIFAWLKWEQNKQLNWLFMFAISAGIAVLNKWMLGLIVFEGFIFYHLFLEKNFFKKQTLMSFGLAIFISFCILLPWQLYIFSAFPLEAAHEFRYNNLHFSETLEGHGGGNWFYINLLKEHFKHLEIFILIGFFITVLQSKNHSKRWTLFLISVSVYLFFTLAKTKMTHYVLMVSPLLILFIAYTFEQIFACFLKQNIKWGLLLLLPFVAFLFFDLEHFYEFQNPLKTSWVYGYREERINTTAIISQNKKDWKPSTLIYNCPLLTNIDVQFFSNAIAYSNIDSVDLIKLKARGYELIDFQKLNLK